MDNANTGRAIGHIPKDEPVFVIRGQDRVGWAAVEAYANLAEAIGADPEMVAAARGHARAMRSWAREYGKIPDLPKE